MAAHSRSEVKDGFPYNARRCKYCGLITGGSIESDEDCPDNPNRLLTKNEKMEAAIKRVLATARFIEAGTWHISTDSIQLLEEAIK